MHILAYVYHWGRDEIRNLPRTERRRWVEMIIDQKKKENKAVEDDISETKANSSLRR